MGDSGYGFNNLNLCLASHCSYNLNARLYIFVLSLLRIQSCTKPVSIFLPYPFSVFRKLWNETIFSVDLSIAIELKTLVQVSSFYSAFHLLGFVLKGFRIQKLFFDSPPLKFRAETCKAGFEVENLERVSGIRRVSGILLFCL